MPAARPSQASVSNAIGAIVAAGLVPAEIRVSPDGAFSIEIVHLPQAGKINKMGGVGDSRTLPRWGD